MAWALLLDFGRSLDACGMAHDRSRREAGKTGNLQLELVSESGIQYFDNSKDSSAAAATTAALTFCSCRSPQSLPAPLDHLLTPACKVRSSCAMSCETDFGMAPLQLRLPSPSPSATCGERLSICCTDLRTRRSARGDWHKKILRAAFGLFLSLFRFFLFCCFASFYHPF